MLKFFSKLTEWLNEPADLDDVEIDPLLHPTLRKMTSRELADLPFGSSRNGDAGRNNCPA